MCLSLYFLPERLLDEVGGLWRWISPQLEVVKLRIGLTEPFEELDLKKIIYRKLRLKQPLHLFCSLPYQ